MSQIAVATKNAMLDAVIKDATIWAQFHLGQPAGDGTGDEATETRRIQLAFANSAVGGEISNSSASAGLSNLAATETWTHITLWDDEVAGAFIGWAELSYPFEADAAGDFDGFAAGAVTVAS